MSTYGKPYQTIVSVLSLLKHSKQHINQIFITVEKQQPFGQYGDIQKVLQALNSQVKCELYYPKYFYNLGEVDYQQAKVDDSYRWSLPYQYALEKTKQPLLFIMHNDMVFRNDIIGPMLAAFKDNPVLAGAGAIGQCWLCPANTAGFCNGFKFKDYKPTQQEAIKLHQSHNTSRKIKDIEILETGWVHPLPECRLNEHACMLNTEIYKKTTLPQGDNICFGANWGYTADLGTGWFYQMVNQGFDFKHIVLEDHATHSQFNPAGQGIGTYSKEDNYRLSEQNALHYLLEYYEFNENLKFNHKRLRLVANSKGKTKQLIVKMMHQLRPK